MDKRKMKRKDILAKFLRNRMYDKGLTQRELALLCEIPESTIHSYMEGCRIPGAIPLVALAQVLDFTLEDLIQLYKK